MGHDTSASKFTEELMQIDIAEKIAELAKEGDARFLEIGKLLREFYDSLDGEEVLKGEC